MEDFQRLENIYLKDPEAWFDHQEALRKTIIFYHPGVMFASDLKTAIDEGGTWNWIKFASWWVCPSFTKVRGGFNIALSVPKFSFSVQFTLPQVKVMGYQIKGSVFGFGTRLNLGSRTFGLDFHTLPTYGLTFKGINYPVPHLHFGNPGVFSEKHHIELLGPAGAFEDYMFKGGKYTDHLRDYIIKR